MVVSADSSIPITVAARRALIDTPPESPPQSQCPVETTGSRHLDVAAAEKPAVPLPVRARPSQRGGTSVAN
jgi:hypothetical protein